MTLSEFWWSSGTTQSGGEGDPILASARFFGNSRINVPASTVTGGMYTLSFWMKVGWHSTSANYAIWARSSSTSEVSWHAGQIKSASGGVTESIPGTYYDCTGWYHVFVTKSTAGENTNGNIWINGKDMGSVMVPSPLSGQNFAWGRRPNNNNPFQGWIANIQYFSGTVLSVDKFGRYHNDQWVPVRPNVSLSDYGSDGYELLFDDPSDMGNDTSGNNNHATLTGFNVSNPETNSTNDGLSWSTDSPTQNNTQYSFLQTYKLTGKPQHGGSRGNCQKNVWGSPGGYSGYNVVNVPMPPGGGKYELMFTGSNVCCYGSAAQFFGVSDSHGLMADGGNPTSKNMLTWEPQSGRIMKNGVAVDTGPTWYFGHNGESSRVRIMLDRDTNVLTCYQPTRGGLPTSVSYTYDLGDYGENESLYFFTGGNAPSGHGVTQSMAATNTTNPCGTNTFPDPPIKRGASFARVLTGDSTILNRCKSTFPIGLWIIKSASTSNQWQFWNSTNGDSSVSRSPANDITAYANPSGSTIAFGFKESTRSGFNLTAGLHNLAGPPSFIINKGNYVYHHNLESTEYLRLSSSDGAQSGTWSVTSSSISGPGDATDNSFYYAWRTVPGFSHFGKYQGNGSSTNGTYVPLDFKPSLVIVKKYSTSGGDWIIANGVQETLNPVSFDLSFNQTNGQNNNILIDMCASGFKMRSNNTSTNQSGHWYVYAAWAECPFQYATAR